MTEAIDQIVARLWPGRTVRVEQLLGGSRTPTTWSTSATSKSWCVCPVRYSGCSASTGDTRRQRTTSRLPSASLPRSFLSSEDGELAGDAFSPRSSDTASRTRSRTDARHCRFDVAAPSPRRIDRRCLRPVHDRSHLSRDGERSRGRRALRLRCRHQVLDAISAVRPFRASAFCHNDYLNGNFIFDGEVRIVDWEYAGMGDPFFDLANLSVNHGFDAAADEAILGDYFGRCTEQLSATLSLMKLVSEMREAMWGVVQLAVSTLDFDYAAYCRERSDHFFALLAEMAFDDARPSCVGRSTIRGLTEAARRSAHEGGESLPRCRLQPAARLAGQTDSPRRCDSPP